MSSRDGPLTSVPTEGVTRSAIRGSRREAPNRLPLFRSVSDGDELDVIKVPDAVIPTAEGDDIRVLHVDDEPRMGELTKDLLEMVADGIHVKTATSGVEALSMLGDQRVDCIVSDYDMPNLNGIEFLAAVRDRDPDLPFILFTGKGSEEIASDAIAKGVTDYMQKGGGRDRYEVLANRIQNAVDRYRSQNRFWEAFSWYRRLVEEGLTGICIVRDGEFVFVNDRLAEMLGREKGELIGCAPEELAASEDDAAVFEELGRIQDGSSDGQRFELTAVRPDGTPVRLEIHAGLVEFEEHLSRLGVVLEQE